MMEASNHRSAIRRACAVGLAILLCGGCNQQGISKLKLEHREQRDQITQLERALADRDAKIATLNRRIEALTGFAPDRPADLFAPVEIAFAPLTGGADYDKKAGDDGINVYLRLIDADGDAVKAPGRITIQLLDNSDLSQPRRVGLYQFADARSLSQAWYGKFGTGHYTLKCPFPPNVRLPESRRLLVSAEFVDYRTGHTLTTSGEVEFAGAGP